MKSVPCEYTLAHDGWKNKVNFLSEIVVCVNWNSDLNPTDFYSNLINLFDIVQKFKTFLIVAAL